MALEQQPQPEQPQPPPQPRQATLRLPRRNPYVTYTILALTVLVYLLQMLTTWWLGYDLPALWGIKQNAHIIAGEVWRLFTPMLLHGNLLHIGFNMYAITILGPQLERHYGHAKFLILYFVGGFAGVVASFALTEAPSLGASTAIFALLAAQGVFAYQNQAVFGAQARRALRSILNIALINFLIGLSPGIDNWAHLGGAMGGALVSWFGGPLYKIKGEMPDLYLENQRLTGDFFRSALAAAVLFAFLAAGLIYIWDN